VTALLSYLTSASDSRGAPHLVPRRLLATADEVIEQAQSIKEEAIALAVATCGATLSKKSKIEELPKSRESAFLAASAAASLSTACTKLCGRSLEILCGPAHRRA